MSLDRVPGPGELYIGGLISLRRYEALKKAKITHVVSALQPPYDGELFAPYKQLAIDIFDEEDENILQWFTTSNAFIKDGLDQGGGVLVHCAMGKSRSATLCIAYMLSTDRSLTPLAALNSLRGSRAIVEPNPGFWYQLELYHGMGCPEDVDVEPAYQRWLYRREVEMSVACGRAPDTIRFEDEATSGEVDPSPTTSHPDVQLRCRRCRHILAKSPFILGHEPKPASATQTARLLQQGPISSLGNESSNSSESGQKPAATPQCAHFFLDPLSWMRSELEEGKLEGKLNCPNPKCEVNVGKYAWQGMECSCREWVTPAISLLRSRIDEVRPRPVGGVRLPPGMSSSGSGSGSSVGSKGPAPLNGKI